MSQTKVNGSDCVDVTGDIEMKMKMMLEIIGENTLITTW